MNITFSNPLQLHRTGAGRPYGQLFDYLMKQKKHNVKFISGFFLVKSLYSGTHLHPESLEQGAMSDMLATFEILPSDIFLGAGCASLSQILTLRFKEGSTKIITSWFSSHYDFASKVLEREYSAMKMDVTPIDPYLIWRAKHEQKFSNAIIVPSAHCKTTYDSDPICKGKVWVANFGVDSKKYYPAEKKPEDFRVLFAGGNWARKGFRYLITAWNELHIKDGLLTTLSLGPGVFPPMYRTNYEGFVPDEKVPEYFRNQSIFVLPSCEEGQALAVLEAMASGLPVIVTAETGAPITDGKEGFIIPSRDVKALKEAIQYFYDNPAEVSIFSKRAREKAESMTWDKFGKRVVEICERVSNK